MDNAAVLLVAAAVFAWGALSMRLERADLTAPVVFVVLGALMAWWGLVDAPSAPERLKPLVELTLVWVLFSDAARIPLRETRPDVGRYVRLLAVGLPLTVLAGWGLAAWLFPGQSVWTVLLIAAALAPTDAALGVPVVTNPAIPARIRRLITVESGLNDGIVTPVVMLALAGAASEEGIHSAPGLAEATAELAIGAAFGVLAGVAGGWVLRQARRRGWAAEDFTGIAVLALAIAAYTGSVAVHGNGFIAAFCGGLAFGAVAGRRGPAELAFLEQAGGLVSLLVWLAFGAISAPIIRDRIDLATVGYAVLSLTVIRMVPVALASLGAGVDRGTVLFVGWFGPRGLASLVFALLALEELGAGADRAVTVIGVTVFLSVLAHGLSAGPLTARYGASEASRGLDTKDEPPDSRPRTSATRARRCCRPGSGAPRPPSRRLGLTGHPWPGPGIDNPGGVTPTVPPSPVPRPGAGAPRSSRRARTAGRANAPPRRPGCPHATAGLRCVAWPGRRRWRHVRTCGSAGLLTA